MRSEPDSNRGRGFRFTVHGLKMKTFGSTISGPLASPAARGLFKQTLQGLAWAGLLWTLVWGAKPLLAAPQVYQLNFQKQMPLRQAQDGFTYTIQKGDYVYAILRRLEVPEHRLEEALDRVKRLNPHLQDLDRVKPGDSLHLPDSFIRKEAVPMAPAAEASDGSSSRSKAYTVQPGDTVFAILREQTGLPDAQIRWQALKAFHRLNPGLKSLDRIQPGQQLQIPLVMEGGEASGTGGPAQIPTPAPSKHAGEPSAKPGARSPSPPAVAALPEKTIVRSLLEAFGFRLVQGSDLLLPSGEDEWVRINLERMELARTAWGESVLLVPGPLENERDHEAFAAAGLKTCLVPRSWDRMEVFQALEAVLRPRFIAWTAQQSVILPFQEGILELRSDHLVAIRRQGALQFYLVQPDPGKERRPSGLLTGFLAAKGVRFLVPAGASNSGLTWTMPGFPDRRSLLVPRLPRSGFGPALSASVPVADLGSMAQDLDFASVFSGLKDRGKARRQRLAVTVYASDAGEIRLRLPVIRLQLPPGEIFLLEEEQGDPYLVALLNLKGYAAYLLTG